MPANSKRVPRLGKVETTSAIESIDDPRVLAVLQEFRLIFKSVRTHFRSVEKFAGISGAQVWMLSEIRRSPGLRVNDLARAMSIHQSTASNLLERLERAGLVTRRRDPSDQRVVRLALSPAGRRVAATAPGPAQGVLPAALSRLPAADLDQLKHSLSKVSRLLPGDGTRARKTPLSEI